MRVDVPRLRQAHQRVAARRQLGRHLAARRWLSQPARAARRGLQAGIRGFSLVTLMPVLCCRQASPAAPSLHREYDLFFETSAASQPEKHRSSEPQSQQQQPEGGPTLLSSVARDAASASGGAGFGATCRAKHARTCASTLSTHMHDRGCAVVLSTGPAYTIFPSHWPAYWGWFAEKAGRHLHRV